MRIVLRLLVGILPLALSLIFGYLLTGPLSLGGGDKDIVLAIPLVAWSVLFLVFFLVFSMRRRPLLWSFGVAACVSAGLLLVAWLAFLLLAI